MVDWTITGTPYSCVTDLATLNKLKSTLDYHTQYFGVPSKSTATPAQLKQMQDDYNNAKIKYDASGCGKDPDTDNCLSYQARIADLQSTIAL